MTSAIRRSSRLPSSLRNSRRVVRGAHRTRANLTSPRTPWGDPDFAGIWNYATMTPLERPRDVCRQSRAHRRGERPPTSSGRTSGRPPPTTRQALTGGIPGTRRSDEPPHRTVIADPADGRIAAAHAGRRRSARPTRAQASRERSADGPEDFALNVRCLLWSTAGPPMLPGVYNNNVQFVQTRANIVIVNDDPRRPDRADGWPAARHR